MQFMLAKRLNRVENTRNWLSKGGGPKKPLVGSGSKVKKLLNSTLSWHVVKQKQCRSVQAAERTKQINGRAVQMLQDA